MQIVLPAGSFNVLVTISSGLLRFGLEGSIKFSNSKIN